MARARPGLQKAINEILERHGSNGKPLSLRQAERRTGLSPATIGELAKANARTAQTLRRFGGGFGEDVERLLILAGFVDEIDRKEYSTSGSPLTMPAVETLAPEPEVHLFIERYHKALDAMPAGRFRALLLERLRYDTELLEALLLHQTAGGVGADPGAQASVSYSPGDQVLP